MKPRAKGYSFDGEGGMKSEMITVRSVCDTKWQTSEEKTVCRTQIRLYLELEIEILVRKEKKKYYFGAEHASRENQSTMVIFFILVHKNVYRIGFQEIKIRR